MIKFERFTLDNGLRVILHFDPSTPLVAVNTLYDVGARDEDPDHTGFAHLFEHLMFEGSKHIPDYDHELQLAGGENNAFTNNDITNYYLTLPAQNLETALWLESDRMMELAFSEEKLHIQKNIVTEEFRQTFLDQPYGDVMALLRSLVYQVHPYKWSTIGKDIQHISRVTLPQVKDFFYRFYRPNNAIVSIAGNIDMETTRKLVEKWFADIEPGESIVRNLPPEPAQNAKRELTVEKDVPFDEVYLAFHTGTRLDRSFYITDLITDILAGGRSSRMMENLVRKKKIFSEANAFISGSIDTGFLVLTGKIHKGNDVQDALEMLWEEINDLSNHLIDPYELQKVINKTETSNVFSQTGVLPKAMNLAYYELLGDANLINSQDQTYFTISQDDVLQTCKEIFKPSRTNILKYLSNH
ncbi:MAG: M16 family metallopeptidase [Bacteroidota bacterium]